MEEQPTDETSAESPTPEAQGAADPQDPAEIARLNAERLEKHRRKHKGLLPESWRVKLPVFEGPLDLLLHLIRIDEVEISDIPVALICDQYHEYLGLMEELDLDIAGEYIYEAALLIQLKARMLLPQPKVEEGEEAPEDPREELVRRLLEYRRLKDAAQTLAEVDSVRSGVWTRQPERIDPDPDDNELDLGDLSLFDLLSVFRTVLQRYDNENPPPLIFRGESYSVRGQVDRLLKRLDRTRPVDMVDDLLALSCRSEAIASFLAILELTKMGLMRLHQPEQGGVLLYRTDREVSLAELEAISQ
ncbi:MAG: segregation/condensation protein A [Acidobacteriota bacterium]